MFFPWRDHPGEAAWGSYLRIPHVRKGGGSLSRKKDTDYLTISARIHAMENRMLTRERMDRMIDARDEGEALKVLAECGYGGGEGVSDGQEIDQVLSQARADVFREIRGAVPDPKVADIFQMKYDYHNAKTLVKGEAMGVDAERLLLEGGRYDPRELAEGYRKDSLSWVSPTFQRAIQEARGLLRETRDPQRADVALDRACYQEMAQLARACQSAFLEGYVRLSIDAANLRTAVRVARMEKGSDFLLQVLLPGGSVSEKALAAARGEELGSLFQAGPLAQPAQLGAKAARPAGGTLIAFERACDDAVTRYVENAKRVPFGEETVIAYLYAKEAEFTAVRTILASRRAGLDGAAIRERLRETYV